MFMYGGMKALTFLFVSILPSIWIFPTVLSLEAYAKSPVVRKTEFNYPPRKYFYFDDSEVILYHELGKVHRSDDEGATWSQIKGVKENAAAALIPHPFDAKTAFILTEGTEHYLTTDRGATWSSFKVSDSPSLMQSPLVFSASDPSYILYIGMRCEITGGWAGLSCQDNAYYTTSMFSSSPSPLIDRVAKCIFMRGTKIFKEDTNKAILCIDVDPESSRPWPENMRLIKSEDWFATKEVVEMDPQKVVRGFIGVGSVQKFIVAAVKSSGTEELALYVTDDGSRWDRAHFPSDHGGILEEAYTILQSTPHSIQVDVLSTLSIHNQVGALFTSNSNGSYFTRTLDHTNRNSMGIVDFEKVQGIEGIMMANVVKNWEKIQERGRDVEKEIQSMISFDDGRTWQPLATADGANLQLHSESEAHNLGLVFSSPAPGVLMGIGNTGKQLKPYKEGDLWVSDDAGLNWRFSRKGPHQYEFGDQGGILVAVAEGDSETDKLLYSFNRGKDWESVDLETKIKPLYLTTLPDSTSQKFTLYGEKGGWDGKHIIYAIDFKGIRERKCELNKDDPGKGDFEKWYARYDADGKPSCLMGHKQLYWRKKADVDCFVGEKYKDPEPVEENCSCTDADFECDWNYELKDGKCVLFGEERVIDGTCNEEGDKYRVSSGYRLIPGNTCLREGGVNKDEPVEKTCGKEGLPGKPAPATGKIVVNTHKFNGRTGQYFYLERSETSSGDDETIILHIDASHIYVSHDGGAEWEQILKSENIDTIIPNPYFKDWVFFLGSGDNVWYTRNRARSISKFNTDGHDRSLIPDTDDMAFHPHHAGYIIRIAQINCDGKEVDGKGCHAFGFYTKNAGETWHDLIGYVRNCKWIQGVKNQANSTLIYCSQLEDQTGDQSSKGPYTQLVSSTDFFDNTQMIFKDVSGFANLDEYVVVAQVSKNGENLQMSVTVDGKIFADADFPPKFKAHPQTGYTVVDSFSSSIFLHVTTNDQMGQEMGTLMKSNSNGTYYVQSLDAVSRNQVGYVDFERVQGLEGVDLLNVVSNVKNVKKEGKRLKTMITHNDGGEWNYLTPPQKDSNGKAFGCSGKLDKCSLNLHGYTERKDVRDTYSSGSAVGVLLGVGNVGEYMKDYKEGNTFISSDAGITWREVHKGAYTWEFGDQGAIIVVVKDGEETDKVLYSRDEGRSWEEFVFAEAGAKVIVDSLGTVPSDTSRKFMIIAHEPRESDKFLSIQLDFTGLTSTQCRFDIENPENGDFELWTPQHPDGETNCLFGHEAQYYRRRVDPAPDCYIGYKIPQPHKIIRNCTCTRQDFECEYNFVRGTDGSCQQVAAPLDPTGVCKDPDVVQWYDTSPYRKIPLSTCEGGLELDHREAEALPCPGHEEEFYGKRRGLHGFALAYVILLVFGLTGVCGYIFWKRYASGRFGQIRLGEGSDPSNQPAYIKYPLIAIQGIITAVILLPEFIASGLRWAQTKFTRQKRYKTRQSFARDGYSALEEETFNDAELLSDVEAGEEDL